MKNILFFTPILVLFTLQSCVTMFGKQETIVHINSTPPGAEVYLNGVKMGVTPANIPVRRQKGDVRVTLKNEGGDSKSFPIKYAISPYILFNAYNGFLIGIAVDYITGAYKRVRQTYYDVNFTDAKAQYSMRNNFFVRTVSDTFYIEDKVKETAGKKLAVTLLSGENKKIPLSDVISFKTRSFEGYTIKTKWSNIPNSLFEYRPYLPDLNKRKPKKAIMQVMIKYENYSLLSGFHDGTGFRGNQEYFYLFDKDSFVAEVTAKNMIAVFSKYLNSCDQFNVNLNDPAMPKGNVLDMVKIWYKSCYDNK
ncbi:MAG: PEGA domain-containing protein [Bacteroidetes bacterium]|nr:PEGA domain-containing protein [Bacteroidota bacterium]